MSLSLTSSEATSEPIRSTAHYYKPKINLNMPKLLGRSQHQYTRVPVNELFKAVDNGRGKYRAIICIAWLSMFWDGWKPRRGSKRVKSEKVLFTRRMMKNQFGYSEDLIRRGLADLKRANRITVQTQGFYTGHHNSGTYYKLEWMPGKHSQKINLYWGLMASKVFLSLSVTLQAVLLMLHTIHFRKENRLTIKPNSLDKFKVSRKKLPRYIDELKSAGLLDIVDENTYSFTWIDLKGKPDFERLQTEATVRRIKNSVPNCTKQCP
mgnify:CR=1 FL=1